MPDKATRIVGLQAYQFRLLFLALMLVMLYTLVQSSGLMEDTSPDAIRHTIQAWGLAGVALYIGLFTLGQLMYVPGMLFVIAAGLAYGPLWGTIIGMVGAMIAMSVTFYVGRRVGGSPLAGVKRRGFARLMGHLHKSPVVTIALMRLMVSTAPWLNYLLALTAVQFRQYFWGSALGVAIPVVATVWFSDLLLQYLTQ